MSRYALSNNTDFSELIEIKFPGCFEKSRYSKKIIDTITYSFPVMPPEKQTADELNISTRWLQHECRQAFNLTYTQLSRTFKIYEAVRVFHETNRDNLETAVLLHYVNESNMARDFKKVLKMPPQMVRLKLQTQTPLELFT